MARRLVHRSTIITFTLTLIALGGCADDHGAELDASPVPADDGGAPDVDADSDTDSDSDSDTDSDTDTDTDSDSDTDGDSDTAADAGDAVDAGGDSGAPGDAGADAAADTDTGTGAATPTALYATSFEEGDPQFEKVMGGGTFSNEPPVGTFARTGEQVITNSSITTSYDGRVIRSVDCIALLNDSDPLVAVGHAMASSANGGNQLRARFKMVWYAAPECEWPIAAKGTAGPSVVLPQDEYVAVTFDAAPASSATHFRIELEVRDDNGEPNDEDDWAADDVSAAQ